MFASTRPKPGYRRTTAIIFLVVALFIYPRVGVCADGEGHRRLTELVKPYYPELARRMRLSGSIMLRITILPNGRVAEVQFEKGHPLLLRAAEEAVRQWRYSAATETTMQSVQVNFDLPH